MKKVLVLVLCCSLPFATLFACQKEYTGEYIEWGEKTDGNATELLADNNIPFEIKNGIIYIPEDAFDKAINCCS
ncbi:hypothetical protein GLV94_19470 [Virgibacillus halodenitrificans]|uniref:Lipoprotein n=1 Tax=Virgibacillus halodenitrificans TaxID=1482 RepID=A0ABR7VJM8_VIRHA|nr:hypothetical protein [Virgibacillus halodenitrificans]MBD1221906.1 hypothetical protein [Virgibacillus halodenitrificans]MYL47820.1 hypothetical protein [Virgibacillus halodenitrificans]